MRLYTLEEARALLPSVIPVLEELRDHVALLRAAQGSVRTAAKAAGGNGHLPGHGWDEPGDGGEANRVLENRLSEASKRLDEWGIELKDPERGLIDFYWERDGEIVYLCYLLGEPDIEWWHPTDAGFAGRQRLP